MSSLATPLRKQLESTITRARKIAEDGARHALEALAVHEAKPYPHMAEVQKALRTKLRAQARQLGDSESIARTGGHEIKHLAEKVAYDQWHRLLFARYLLENHLLISPTHGVAVSLNDCEELAPSEGLKDAWAVAARFAAEELPEIFRGDDPAGAIDMAVNDRIPLIQLVTDLPVEVFTAGDSLGWCYQFWQAERKDEVNAAGSKIGADELPAVTQLFTEDYMVDFLLDNTLGAWHSGRIIAANPKLAETAQSEVELRQALALPGCPWSYLRFINGADGKWTPAAGTFDGWPKSAAELKCLDPCMGSGHFVVAMFERLVALRVAEEIADEAAAVDAVIRDNLYGLEIDPRCTQIAAFNLALAAWRRVGYRKLPAMNLACSGLAPNTSKADWLAIAGKDEKLKNGMARLYRLFQDAPILGSLINPRAAEGDLLEAGFHELQPLLEKALAHETKNESAHEMAVTARGLAKAAEILADQFTLVATNVPYLGKGKQDEELKDYCERFHKEAAADLATCFVERSLAFCNISGSTALVTPQNWLSQNAYKHLRRALLSSVEWNAVVRLGARAFETIGGDVVNVALLIQSTKQASVSFASMACDASEPRSAREKAVSLREAPVVLPPQESQLKNPGCSIQFAVIPSGGRIGTFGFVRGGITSGDSPYFRKYFWEVDCTDTRWLFQQGAVEKTVEFGGRELVLLWEEGMGELVNRTSGGGSTIAGREVWGQRGIVMTYIGGIKVTRYYGEPFENVICVLIPRDPSHLAALWTFASSTEFESAVRSVSPQLSISVRYFENTPIDMAKWKELAKREYPRGLPKQFSNDPTQSLFTGHPTEAVQPLHVAVARLMGYQWPRQTGSSFPDCPALGPDGLERLADDDGIVPISPTKGEGSAAERLRELLARAYGKEWNAIRQEELLAQVDYTGASLEDWLRNGFFEQHCALFHHRPFIWHVWDGHKNGFSALVNYHKLTHANLEKLTFAYLGDWIRRQQAAVDAGEAGSDARLQAAKQLQTALKLILEGEPPYDIFVRWKPLSQQSIGWRPDLNDGVRMNIRPFATADVLRKRVKIKWEKDRGKEAVRDKHEFPWFWGWDEKTQDFAGRGKEPDGNRWNNCHYTTAAKKAAKGTR